MSFYYTASLTPTFEKIVFKMSIDHMWQNIYAQYLHKGHKDVISNVLH